MAVVGAKQAQNEEDCGGADVSVDAGVADKHAELVEYQKDKNNKRKRIRKTRIIRGSGSERQE